MHLSPTSKLGYCTDEPLRSQRISSGFLTYISKLFPIWTVNINPDISMLA